MDEQISESLESMQDIKRLDKAERKRNGSGRERERERVNPSICNLLAPQS